MEPHTKWAKHRLHLAICTILADDRGLNATIDKVVIEIASYRADNLLAFDDGTSGVSAS